MALATIPSGKMGKTEDWEIFLRTNPGRHNDTGRAGLSKALKDAGVETPRIERELLDQKAVIKWARDSEEIWPALRWLHHPRNGGLKGWKAIKDSKLEGIVAGIPDLSLPCHRGIYPGIYIELKVKPNYPGPRQRECIVFLREQGFFVDVCFSAGEAIALLQMYLTLTPGSELSYSYTPKEQKS